MTIPYPHIPPVLVRVGPFAVRWYGVMYLVGYFVGYRIMRARIERGPSVPNTSHDTAV